MDKAAMLEVSEATRCFAKQRMPEVKVVTVVLGSKNEAGKREVVVDFGGMDAKRAGRLVRSLYDAIMRGSVEEESEVAFVDIRGVDWSPINASTVRVEAGRRL